MKFLRNLLAVLVGLFIFTFIGFLFMIAIISVSSSEKIVEIEPNSVLLLELEGNIVERETEDPFENLSIPGDMAKKMGLKEVKEAISHARDDENIKGIFLVPKSFSAGFSSLSELRAVLHDFRESGKFIISYSEFYTEKGYYLASVSDEIYLIPDFGSVELNGLNVTTFYIKKMLEKLEVEPEIFRVGDFKSAVEPFLREDMSPENRKQISSFLNSIYDELLTKMAEDRQIPVAALRNISDSMLVKNGHDAVRLKIISDLKYYDDVNQILEDRLEIAEDEDVNFVNYRKYNKSYTHAGVSKDRIGVIMGSGEIVYGKGSNDNIGGTKYAEEIRKARENEKVKAIVIRVNSPGGSALASDMIWREVRLAAEKKPVIASMSDVAASGGYYIAMAADKIVANPTTITGSIGIFGLLFNAKSLLKNKLGITTDVVNTGHFSDIYTLTRPLSDFEKSIIQKSIDEGYETFTSKAAEGRGMEIEELLKVASGRVWSGKEAKEIGLIDEFGSLEDAIDMAAEMADLEEYRVSYYPEQKTVLEQIMEELGQDIETKILQNRLGDLYPVYEKIRKIEHYNGILFRMPYDIEIN